VKRWAQAASMGSPLTRVRCTTAPATTSKMRSISAPGLRPGSAPPSGGSSPRDWTQAEGVVAGGLGDDGHQAGLGLGVAEEGREVLHDALDVGAEAAEVGQLQLVVEEGGDGVHHEVAFVGPPPVDRGLGHPRAGGDIAHAEPGPAQFDEGRAGRVEDGAVGIGAAGAAGAFSGGGRAHGWAPYPCCESLGHAVTLRGVAKGIWASIARERRGGGRIRACSHGTCL
jgi:hypothetical protein